MDFASDKTYLSKNKLQNVKNLSLKKFKDDEVFDRFDEKDSLIANENKLNNNNYDRVFHDENISSQNINSYKTERDRSVSVKKIRDTSLDKPYSDLEDQPKINSNHKLKTIKNNLNLNPDKNQLNRAGNVNNFTINPLNQRKEKTEFVPFRPSLPMTSNNTFNRIRPEIPGYSNDLKLPRFTLQDKIDNANFNSNNTRQSMNINEFQHNTNIINQRKTIINFNNNFNIPNESPQNRTRINHINFNLNNNPNFNIEQNFPQHNINNIQNNIFSQNQRLRTNFTYKHNNFPIPFRPNIINNSIQIQVDDYGKINPNPNIDMKVPIKINESIRKSENMNSTPNEDQKSFSSKNMELNMSSFSNSQNVIYEREVDTNVIKLDFSFMKEKINCATGIPHLCKKCEAVLNKYSIIKETENKSKLWICEFCSYKNEILVDLEEIPKDEIIDFYIQSLNNNSIIDPIIIFCIDISGSMSVSEMIEGKHEIKGQVKPDYDKYLLDELESCFYKIVFENQDKSYISRLQCIQNATEEIMKNVRNDNPNKKFGFVLFNDEVISIGEGTEMVKINGNNLDDYDHIVQYAEQNSDIITKSIKDSIDDLTEKLYKIEEKGQTSLGSAILFSINLIKNNMPGSTIFLFTDGLANVGIGCLDSISTLEEFEIAKNFYEKLGKMARDKGIVINLFTFENTECKIELLKYLCDLTGGDIIRVKMSDILNHFSESFKKEINATDVKITVRLNNLMSFRKEDPNLLKHDGSVLIKEIGNVNNDTEVYLEYHFKSSKDIVNKYPEFDLNNLEEVPFQTVVEYTNNSGGRFMRVITKKQKISYEKEEVLKQSDCSILSINALKKSSSIANKGEYREAQAEALAWKGFIKNSSMHSSSKGSQDVNVFNNNMRILNGSLQRIHLEEKSNNNPEVNNIINNNSFRIFNRNDEFSSQLYNLSHLSMNKAFKK